MHNFKQGELVKVRYSRELYRIEGYKKELLAKDGVVTSVVRYQLKNMKNDEIVYKAGEDMIPENIEIVDYLLDTYNDLMFLYEVIKDEVYLTQAKNAFIQLEEEVNGHAN